MVACALLAFAAAGAGAHRFSARTTAEIASGGPTGANGTVSSPKAVCERNRLVELFRVDELGGAAQSYGTDRTDSSGNWSVTADLVAGEYYVTVKKSRAASSAKKKKRHSHRCKRARSKGKRL